MRFSQRIGKTSVRNALQIENIDDILANKLWNNFLFMYEGINHFNQERISKIIWDDFFNLKTDEIPSYNNSEVNISSFLTYVKVWFFKSERFEKYDFIEFIVLVDNKLTQTGFIDYCNATLERECAGYRLIDNKIIPITSELEINTIEEALDIAKGIKNVEIHLNTALEYLSNRNHPDYRNSIKESISGVEAFCKLMIGNQSDSLGKSLGQIEKSHKLPGSLKTAFSALYGYTSDSGGIRHALLEDDIIVTQEDAVFMLVSCSAFINYLKSKI